MKQYHDHLNEILKSGTIKSAAREGMPSSISLFGYQNRYNLNNGFPIITTKKINFNNIVVELLWFLRGDTNIKYLIENKCNIWNEDAYNYYIKLCKKENIYNVLNFEEFIDSIKNNTHVKILPFNYKLGYCGVQYGELWRNLKGVSNGNEIKIDQVQDLINGLQNNPMGRRHIIDAWNPPTLDDMALNACHVFVQFNCRKLSLSDKVDWIKNKENCDENNANSSLHGYNLNKELDFDNHPTLNIPKYYIDCQLYQRSADIFLGVPYNISSYALMTYIIAKICNMIPGEFIHTFGDSHIYSNHFDQVKEQLSRDTEMYKLPMLNIKWDDDFLNNIKKDLRWINYIKVEDFELDGYESYPAIKGKLSTGLK